jgi:hypothetical protein
MHESLARYLAGCGGWTWAHEVTFAIYGERGVIDILAWHATSRSLLIIELKSTLADPQDLVAVMDRRRRLAHRIAADRGWRAASVSGWVILLDTRTNRRRVAAHSALLRSAFPADGHVIRSWLRNPSGAVASLSFWANDPTRIIGRKSSHDVAGRATRARADKDPDERGGVSTREAGCRIRACGRTTGPIAAAR